MDYFPPPPPMPAKAKRFHLRRWIGGAFCVLVGITVLGYVAGPQEATTKAPPEAAAPTADAPAATAIDDEFTLNGVYATTYAGDSKAVTDALHELNGALQAADIDAIDSGCARLMVVSTTWGSHAPATEAGRYIKQAADAYVDAATSCLAGDYSGAADDLERGVAATDQASAALSASIPG